MQARITTKNTKVTKPEKSALREGMSFVDGRPGTLREQLQDGRKQGHYKNLLAANQQADYGRCSRRSGNVAQDRLASNTITHLAGTASAIPRQLHRTEGI